MTRTFLLLLLLLAGQLNDLFGRYERGSGELLFSELAEGVAALGDFETLSKVLAHLVEPR